MKLNKTKTLKTLHKEEIVSNNKDVLVFYSNTEMNKYDNVYSYKNIVFKSLSDYKYLNVLSAKIK